GNIDAGKVGSADVGHAAQVEVAEVDLQVGAVRRHAGRELVDVLDEVHEVVGGAEVVRVELGGQAEQGDVVPLELRDHRHPLGEEVEDRLDRLQRLVDLRQDRGGERRDEAAQVEADVVELDVGLGPGEPPVRRVGCVGVEGPAEVEVGGHAREVGVGLVAG